MAEIYFIYNTLRALYTISAAPAQIRGDAKTGTAPAVNPATFGIT